MIDPKQAAEKQAEYFKEMTENLKQVDGYLEIAKFHFLAPQSLPPLLALLGHLLETTRLAHLAFTATLYSVGASDTEEDGDHE